MSIHWSNVDPNLWDLLALLSCATGLIIGARLAFKGRILKVRWTRLVEAVATMFFFGALTAVVSIVLFKTPPPWLASVIGTVAGGLAFFYANREIQKLYGAIAAIIVGGLVMAFMLAMPDPFHWTIVAGLVLAATAIGYRIGILIHAMHIIVGTALAGAQWISMAAVGLIEVVLKRSGEFLLDQALGYLLPGFYLLIELFTNSVGEHLLGLLGVAIWGVVAVVGGLYQYRHIDDPVFERTATLPDMLRQSWQKAIADFKKRAWPLTGAAAAYLGIALLCRSISFDGGPPPSPAAEQASTEQPNAARSSA